MFKKKPYTSFPFLFIHFVSFIGCFTKKALTLHTNVLYITHSCGKNIHIVAFINNMDEEMGEGDRALPLSSKILLRPEQLFGTAIDNKNKNK